MGKSENSGFFRNVSKVNCFFRKFATELRPLIDSRIRFLLHFLRMIGQNLTKFCIHIIIDKIYDGIVKHHILANLQQSYDP